MSARFFGKFLPGIAVAALLWAALPAVCFGQQFGAPVAAGSCATCAPHCQTFHCPHPYKHCQEGPPRICWQCGCPHPICNPCDLPHFGYFETCWSPFPFGPNWGHCVTPPPAAFVNLNPMVHPNIQPRLLPPAGSVNPTPPMTTPMTPMPMPKRDTEELSPPRQQR